MDALSQGYFSTRELSIIALLSASWGILNAFFSPIIFRLFGLPILCDMIGFGVLCIGVWWLKKLGTGTIIGIIATVISLLMNPTGLSFLGFTVASVVFDMIAWLSYYDHMSRESSRGVAMLFANSILSAAIAGGIIAMFFMPNVSLVVWSGLHAVGGAIGGFIGSSLVAALSVRKIRV